MLNLTGFKTALHTANGRTRPRSVALAIMKMKKGSEESRKEEQMEGRKGRSERGWDVKCVPHKPFRRPGRHFGP